MKQGFIIYNICEGGITNISIEICAFICVHVHGQDRANGARTGHQILTIMVLMYYKLFGGGGGEFFEGQMPPCTPLD